jgi:hypothetical protein
MRRRDSTMNTLLSLRLWEHTVASPRAISLGGEMCKCNFRVHPRFSVGLSRDCCLQTMT